MQLEKLPIAFYPSLPTLWQALHPWLISKKYLWVVDRGFAQTSPAGISFKQKLLAPSIEIEGGECVKSWQVLEGLLDKLQEEDPGIEGLVAIGGGATLDVAALAAHLYRRGLELIHVPTTLLAMVDASLGGKCAINWHHMKNRVGAYHDASAIFSSIELLGSDPNHPVVIQGLSEIYKHALIFSRELKEGYLAFLKDKNLKHLGSLLPLAASIKEQVVELEKIKAYQGVRHLLNLGHTVAHALEAVFSITEPAINHGKGDFATQSMMSHGRAVAIGLLLEGYLLKQTWEETFFSHADLRRELYPLIGSWPQLSESQWNRFFEAMKLDKKGSGEDIALTKFGKCFQMIESQSSYLTYCKPQEIVDAWRACEYAMASDLRDKQQP